MARRLSLSAAIALAACLSLASAAHGKTLIYSQAGDDGFKSKPGRLGYSSPIIPGATITIKKLDWSGWGGGKATSSSEVKLCPNMGSCNSFPAPVEAKGLIANAEGDSDVYSKLKVRPEGEDFTLCVYAKVCSG